jgi:hypothetical protein
MELCPIWNIKSLQPEGARDEFAVEHGAPLKKSRSNSGYGVPNNVPAALQTMQKVVRTVREGARSTHISAHYQESGRKALVLLRRFSDDLCRGLVHVIARLSEQAITIHQNSACQIVT